MEVALAMFVAFLACWSLSAVLRPNSYLADESKGNNAVVLCLIVLPTLVVSALIVGLRPESAGYDTVRYVFAYQKISSPLTAVGDGSRYFGNTELLWWPMQSLLRPFLSVRAWLVTNFLLVLAVTFLSYCVAVRPYRLNRFIFALVFSTYFIVYAGNAMRQALAIPVCVLAFFFFFERKYVNWIVLSVLAIGFHWSSIVVILAPLFALRPFNRDLSYVALPLGCLAASTLMSGLVGAVVGFINYSGFSEKYNLYFSGNSESHVGQVWLTANFWLCVSLSMAFLLFCRPSGYRSRALHCFIALYLSLVLFGVRIPDFSERYLAVLLFASPLMVALMISRCRIPAVSKSGLLLTSFLVMGLLVYMSPSTQFTLGYSLS